MIIYRFSIRRMPLPVTSVGCIRPFERWALCLTVTTSSASARACSPPPAHTTPTRGVQKTGDKKVLCVIKDLVQYYLSLSPSYCSTNTFTNQCSATIVTDRSHSPMHCLAG